MPQPTPPTPQKIGLTARCVMWLSWINLCALLVISLLLFVISENWWFSSAMTYAPRIPYLIPAMILLIVSVLWHRSSIAVNLISTTMVLVPIMGLSVPVSKWIDGPSKTGGATLKIVSCNVQGYKPDFASVLAEVGRLNPDVVAFQDATWKSELLEQYFATWYSIRKGEFFVASKYPVTYLATGHFDAFNRNAVVKCEIELPSTKISLFNLHNMTPRHGLRELDLSSPITQHGSTRLSRFLELRAEEAAAVRNYVNESSGDAPTVIVGDFNMPCESSLYQQNWLGYQNAFNTAGIGYGYTFPCTQQYRLPAGLPWIRLDHILVDASWQVHSCSVGTVNGSDHRLITASLRLR